MLSRVITILGLNCLPKHKAKGFGSLLMCFYTQTGTIFENPSQFAGKGNDLHCPEAQQRTRFILWCPVGYLVSNKDLFQNSELVSILITFGL